MNEILRLLVLGVIGLIAGFLNVTAGGGSFLSLPFLIFLGLPPTVANGTNRIAILVQNIFATARFHQFKVIPKGVILLAALPAIAGAVVGAQIAVNINELFFKRMLAIIMIPIMGLIFFGPQREMFRSQPNLSPRQRAGLALAFLGIGIYGGLIQGGIGFLLITLLTLAGYDLVRTNALKVLTVLIFTPFALLIFVANGQVDFLRGSILAIGNATGGWIASRVVVDKGHDFVRWIVMVAVVGFALKLFFG